jgi:hypothetical protein
LSLRRLTHELRELLAESGRSDLSKSALDRVGFTDDGTTLYVHILPKAGWKRLGTGRAYVLAFAGKDDLASLAEMRLLLREASMRQYDDIDAIIRWFDGR